MQTMLCQSLNTVPKTKSIVFFGMCEYVCVFSPVLSVLHHTFAPQSVVDGCQIDPDTRWEMDSAAGMETDLQSDQSVPER